MKYFKNTNNIYFADQTEEINQLLAEDQFQVLEEIIDNQPEFEHKLGHLLLWSDPPVVKRLILWLTKLNEARGYSNTSCNMIVEAVLWAFETDTPITRQTQHQFDISIALLTDFLRYRIPLGLSIYAKYLLMNVFIVSERPDLCLRSFTKAMKNSCSSSIDHIFNKSHNHLIKYLFVNRPLPTFLFEYLINCSYDEYQIIINILDGKSLRKILPDQLQLSKAENTLLQSEDFPMTNIKDNVLERFVFTAKILKEQPDNNHTLGCILHSSKIFRDHFVSFKEDFDFWKSVFRFFYKYPEVFYQDYNIRHFVDFFETQRYFSPEPLKYSLKGRTLTSVRRSAQNWQITNDHNSAHISYSWDPLPIEKWVSSGKAFSYVIEEITDGKRLLAESNTLRHCVFSYAYGCNAGHIHIFSLSKLKNNVKKPYVTIEVRDKSITQVSGKMNMPPTKKAMDLIKAWGALNSLSIKLTIDDY